jgi:adenylosuccinate synthase
MVVRTYPIRVADPKDNPGYTSGRLKREISFAEVATRAGLDAANIESAELTSTTKRKRRVGEFEWDQFKKACGLNAPTDLALTFVDYLSAKNRNARRYEQLTPDTIKWIEEVERLARAPASLISTRYSERAIIDRRNWL